MTYREWLRAASALFLVIILFFLFPVTQNALATEGAELTLKAQVFDVETGLPIPNVTVSFFLTTKEELYFVWESGFLNFQGVTKADGSIISFLDIPEVPSEPIRLFMVSVYSEPQGLWIVEKVVGDGEFSLWYDSEGWEGPRWMGFQPEQFSHNVSTYMFPTLISLNRSESGTTIEVSLFLRRGRLVDLTLINPFHGDDPWFMRAVPSFLWRAYFDESDLYFYANRYLNGNFAPIDNTTLVVAPLGKPIEGTAFIARVSGVSSWGRFYEILRSWTFSFSINVDEGDWINLTPRALRAISKRSQDELSSLLEDLKTSGFTVSNMYTELSRMKLSYEQAISAFEQQKTSEGVIFSRKADELYSSMVNGIQRIPTQAIPSSGWIILTLLFFSFCLSCLVTEEKTKALVLFDVLFFSVFAVFALTQPYLRLFLSDPIASFKRIDIEFLNAFMQIGLPTIVVVLFLALSKVVRDVVKQSFGVAMKNLRRRKVRTILTLTVIMIVSASAMCLLSTSYPIRTMDAKIPLRPLISDGLVIYRYNFGVSSATSIPFQSFEISWLAQQDWVDTSSMYGAKVVSVSNTTTTLTRYNRFYIAAVNGSFLDLFTNAKEIFGTTRLTPEDKGSVLVGQSITEAYQLKEGSKILIDGETFTVKGIFDEGSVGDSLLDINGERLLYRIYDPATRTINVPPDVYPPYPQTGRMAASFLIGSINDFSPSELPIYKVSLVVNQGSANKLDKIVEEVLWASYERREDSVSTFSIYEVKGGKVTCRYLSFETLTFVGSWQTQVAPIIISALIVFVTLHGSVYERRFEIKTLSALGLSPVRVRTMFVAEGLTLGVLGGVLGYVLGFGLINTANITLLEGIEENMATGTPLFISMMIAVSVSIVGCMLPAKKAVLLAVPSKELLKKYAGIINVRNNFAILDVPLHVSIRNLESFNKFIEDIVDRYPTSSVPHGMFAISVEKKETIDDITHDIIVCYASERTAHFLIRISLSKETEPMRVKTLIFPLRGDNLEVMDRWTVDHEHLLPRLAPILRQDLLSYIEKK